MVVWAVVVLLFLIGRWRCAHLPSRHDLRQSKAPCTTRGQRRFAIPFRQYIVFSATMSSDKLTIRSWQATHTRAHQSSQAEEAARAVRPPAFRPARRRPLPAHMCRLSSWLVVAAADSVQPPCLNHGAACSNCSDRRHAPSREVWRQASPNDKFSFFFQANGPREAAHRQWVPRAAPCWRYAAHAQSQYFGRAETLVAC